MSTSLPTEAEAFQSFLIKEIANGGRHKSPEELVQDWRRERQEFDETVAALREAIEDMNAGDRGRPLADVMRDIRAEFGWSNEVSASGGRASAT
jgi:hypothetical protein